MLLERSLLVAEELLLLFVEYLLLALFLFCEGLLAENAAVFEKASAGCDAELDGRVAASRLKGRERGESDGETDGCPIGGKGF